MKKIKFVEKTIPLDRNMFIYGILEYRKNLVESKTSSFQFWKPAEKSYFYDYQLNFLTTYSKMG